MRPPPSRCFSLVMSFLGTALAFFVPAHAQQHYPSRPVTAIVPFAAGGNTDQMARPFFDALGKVMGGAFVVDNRGGAGGTIGAAQIAAAPADGYTLGFSPTSPITNSPHLIKKLPYRFDDFDSICQVFENIFTVAVAPQSKFKTLTELVEMARANPEKLTYGTAGVGSLPHLTGEGFAQKAGIKVTHIPFRGDGQVLPSILGGQIDFSITGMGSATENLRALAIFAPKRHAAIPDVPTAGELGLPSMPPGFQGLFARKGLPSAIISKLENGCEQVVESDTYQSYAKRLNQTVVFLNRNDFTKRAREDSEFKGKLIRDLNLTQP